MASLSVAGNATGTPGALPQSDPQTQPAGLTPTQQLAQRAAGAANPVDQGRALHALDQATGHRGASDALVAEQRAGTPATPHHYHVATVTMCSADEAQQALEAPWVSAPGAPQAVEGTTRHVQLWGNEGHNRITQIVDSHTRTITNITEPGHQFYPGTVTFQVTPQPGNTSRIDVTGTGTGKNALFNDAVGLGFFGLSISAVAQGCQALHGPAIPPM